MISYRHPPLSKLSLFLATVIATAGACMHHRQKKEGEGEEKLDPAEMENETFKGRQKVH